jgi:pyruvate formate lyase activating enzyme
MQRRTFLKYASLAAAGTGLSLNVFPPVAAQDQAAPLPRSETKQESDERYVRPAMFYEKLENNMIRCRLCPHQCRVAPGKRGRCRVRENRNGEYVTLVFGRAVALNNDPIEKKPFYHFLPGSMVLSVATAGCNIACKFCQNWQISQYPPEDVHAKYLGPEDLVRLAKDNNIPSLAFTYAEPTIFYEYVYETARLAAVNGIRCVVVSNGFIQPDPVRKLAPFLAAYKVDLKAFSDDFYRDFCSARLEPVLETLKTLAELGLWHEIVNLVLPTANDEADRIRALAEWVRQNLGVMVPLHFTRFHPMYKIRNLPPTPVSTLENCRQLALDTGLQYVYVGNVPGLPSGNTYCHHCGRQIVERVGLWSVDNQVQQGRCPDCRTIIPGVWT